MAEHAAHSAAAMQMAGVLAFFLFGLGGGLHCAGMCGPLSGLFAPAAGSPTRSTAAGIGIYHAARVVGYALVGLLLALFGTGLGHLFGRTVFFTLFIVALVALTLLPHLPVPQPAARLQARLFSRFRGRPLRSALALGAISPLIPCGLLYAAYAAALAAPNAYLGTLWMAVFAIGTVPLLALSQLGVHGLARRIKPAVRRFFLSGCATATLLFVLWMRWSHHAAH